MKLSDSEDSNRECLNVHGDLPDAWDEGIGREMTAALGMSFTGADKLIGVGSELRAWGASFVAQLQSFPCYLPEPSGVR